MASFETLLEQHKKAAERYVHYRCATPQDAEDILQDVYFTAHRYFHQLKNTDAFKPWLLSIARRKCADHLRKAEPAFVPLDSIPEPAAWRFGRPDPSPVRDVLQTLPEKEQQILRYFYLLEWPKMPLQSI